VIPCESFSRIFIISSIFRVRVSSIANTLLSPQLLWAKLNVP
jgi:hypothetical protein